MIALEDFPKDVLPLALGALELKATAMTTFNHPRFFVADLATPQGATVPVSPR